MTPSQLDLLRKLAQEATPGPWCADVSEPDDVVIWGPKLPDGEDNLIANVTESSVTLVGVARDADANNARFIAACDPTTVLALLDKIARLQEVINKMTTVEVPQPDHGGWTFEENGYTHESGWRIGGNGMRSWLYRLGVSGIVQEMPCNIRGVTRHGFTVRSDVAALMDLVDAMNADKVNP